MFKKRDRNEIRVIRHARVRKKISGTPEVPRLSVYRSKKHIQAQIIDLMNSLKEKTDTSIVLITHDMHLAIEYTDRSIVFADGECIADDAVFKVLSNDEIISRANLKQTSLVTLAHRCGIDPEHYIHYFIDSERGE